MGSDRDEEGAVEDEIPAHDVEMTGFWIGEREVSNADYSEGGDLKPVVDVTWFDAQRFCKTLGESDEWEYDLPSEAQWEYAARGNTGRRYPWGNMRPNENLAVYASAKAQPVGSVPGGAGPFGTLDQAGNVWEWILDCYDQDAYAQRADGEMQENPEVTEEQRCETDTSLFGISAGSDHTPSAFRVLRGGSFGVPARFLRSALRDWDPPVVRLEDVGFRCVFARKREILSVY